MRQFIRLVVLRKPGYPTVMKPNSLVLLLVPIAVLAGCDVAVQQFPPNELHALVVSTSRQAPADVAAEDTTALVDAWFGTPDSPLWPTEQLVDPAARELINVDNLKRASGRVYSDRENRHFGLYNEHCVTCHGVSGGGDGPAALLQNPYPRDFRAGVFKWKSTERSARPTREDLLAVLQRGASGSAMPTFRNVDEADLQALVDYVLYLSVRGEFERQMLADAVDELGYDETRPDDDASLLAVLDSRGEAFATEVARGRLNEIVERWIDASGQVIEVPAETPANSDSIIRGKELFHGQIANCVGCHGPGGRGGVPTVDFDDWTKEYTTRLSVTPSDKEAVRPFRQAGALRPRQIDPRQLDTGVFRGGGDSETLYRRIVTGIAGTPMPAREVAESPSPTSLTSDQIWDLVHYVQAITGKVDEPR